MKQFKFIFLFVFGLFFTNCGDGSGLMDETELDLLNTEKVFSDVENTRKVLIDLYARMRDYTDDCSGTFSRFEAIPQRTSMLDNVTDDGTGNGGLAKPLATQQRMVTASQTPNVNFVAFTNPWNWYYRAIRNANQYIANVDRSPLTDIEKSQSKAEARFLRALFYHELLRWFGPLVITEEVMNPFAFESTKRENMETTVRYIANEFDAVSKPGVLPEKWDDSNFGRATRGAALAYKARTLLYGASPLYKSMGSTVTWQEAADAAKELIDLRLYSLYYNQEDVSKSYSRLFNTRVNEEIIMQYLRANDSDLYNCFSGEDGWGSTALSGGTAPSQALIDSYDMIDGSEPITGYQNDWITPVINPASGYNDANPYINRDPRFYQTILYDKAVWPLVNNTANKMLDISKDMSWVSGYFLVKYLDDRIDHKTGKTSMNFQMMRYAEVLLNYAEAINEAEDNATNRSFAVAQLNEIRNRAGITGTLNAANFTQATLRERIRKERRVELCFEEHRFFDVRRWNIADDVLSRPAVGIKKINGNYVRVALETRIYNSRMNFMPLPLAEVNNCPLIYQNKGY